MPISSARVRLSIDCSMNVAGRKIVVSTSMLGQAGLHLVHRVLDALRDLHRVGAAELLDDQHQAGAVVDDALAPDRLVVLASPCRGRRGAARVPSRCARPAPCRGPPARLDRLHVADVQPLAVRPRRTRRCRPRSCPRTAARRRRRPRTWSPSPGRARRRSRRASPGRPGRGAAASRSPKMLTCATPGTRRMRWRIFQ